MSSAVWIDRVKDNIWSTGWMYRPLRPMNWRHFVGIVSGLFSSGTICWQHLQRLRTLKFLLSMPDYPKQYVLNAPTNCLQNLALVTVPITARTNYQAGNNNVWQLPAH